MTDTMGSGAVSQSALYRLMNTAAGQQESADSALALTPYEYGNVPIMPSTTNPTTQDRHPSAQRLAAGGQWAGKTSQFNHAQAAQDRANVWVTVPVDEVVTRGGASSVQPVYATPTGYAPRPGESRGSIPPTIPAGRPY